MSLSNKLSSIVIQQQDIERLRKRYTFGWEVLDIIIGGKSSIDSGQGFDIRNLDEAELFLRNYGYDLDNPIQKAELFGNYHESVNFIRRYFLQPENIEGLKIDIPKKILELSDIRELFLIASFHLPGQQVDTLGTQLRNWACSILKVMHTIAHVDQDLRTSYFADIQQQIFDRFYKIIHRDSSGSLYIGEKEDDPNKLELIAFETKPKKSRDSTLLKLLHKPENVAEDIFDRVGMRFITKTRLDALRVIKILRDKMIVMPPNIKPSRSRNTMLDLEDFKKQHENIFVLENLTFQTEEALIQALEEGAKSPLTNPENPHSSEFYRAIQFTSRQLIKLSHPLYSDLRELKNLSKSKSFDEDIQKLIERIDLKHIQREIRFFYPFELQIMDQKSFEENERGKSAHSEYKKAQLHTALLRVMGGLADVAR